MRSTPARIGQHPRLVGEAEQFRKCCSERVALLAADHGEMVLQAVEIGEEHDAGFVEAGRRREDVAAERHGRFEQFEELVLAAAAERRERGRSGRRDGVEDAEQRVGIALARRRRSARHS